MQGLKDTRFPKRYKTFCAPELPSGNHLLCSAYLVGHNQVCIILPPTCSLVWWLGPRGGTFPHLVSKVLGSTPTTNPSQKHRPDHKRDNRGWLTHCYGKNLLTELEHPRMGLLWLVQSSGGFPWPPSRNKPKQINGIIPCIVA